MIDWLKDDGVNLAMLNDHVRNQFYNDIMQDRVNQKSCLEIGFGTGLLSLIALEHGAHHITAFECNNERYQLGKEIINVLGLDNKITLIHDRFNYQDLTHHDDVEVVFSEIVSQNLFGEHIWSTIPRQPVKQRFLPRYIGMDVVVCTVSDAMARGIDRNVLKFSEIGFNPGIDISSKFVQHINKLIGNTADISRAFETVPSGGRKIRSHQSTDWNTQPWRQLLLCNGRRISRYRIDMQTQTIQLWDQFHDGLSQSIDFEQQSINLLMSAPAPDGNLVLWPRLWLATDSHALMLDTGHWAPTDPYLFVQHRDDISVTHDFITGKISIK